MIDVEGQVFATVATALRAAFPGISVSGEYNANPQSFPEATIEEMNNAVYTKSQDSESIENHENLFYEINAYSNKASGRKAEAKAIVAAADAVMANMGFTRTFNEPTPNLANATVYRRTARYTTVVDVKTGMFYRG